MALRPESRGGKVPHISLAAAVVLALTVEHPTNHQGQDSPPHKHDADANIKFVDSLYSKSLPAQHVPAKHHLHKNPSNSQTHPTPAQIAEQEITPAEFAAWSRVNECEEGGKWHIKGPTYSGGLGITNINWVKFNGKEFAPGAAEATPREQMVVAERIQGNLPTPDQYGCDSGGW